MPIPTAFNKLAEGMIQDIDLITSSEDEMFDFLISRLDLQERQSAKSFIASPLRQDPGVEALEEIWNSTSADWFVTPDTIHSFFRELQQRL